MTLRNTLALWVVAGGVVPLLAQAGSSPSECAQAQLSVTRLIEAADARLESARQTNSPAAMRAAVDDLQRTLLDLRTRLAPCTNMSAAPAAGAPARPVEPLAAGSDPHAGHAMASTPASAKPPTPGTPRAAAPSAKTTAGADGHAGHTMPSSPTGAPASDPSRTVAPVQQAVDPICGLKVNRLTAPQANYQGQTYFFCSEQHQTLFQKDPLKYVPKTRR